MASEIELPIVDLSPFLGADPGAKAEVARTFARAFEDTGFAILVGHGVPTALADDTYAALTRLSDQLMEAKMARSPPEKAKRRGYLAMGIESVANTLTGETPPDFCEAFVSAAPHRPETDTNIWPACPPELAGLIREWIGEMAALTQHLSRLFPLALDLPETHFAQPHADPALTLRSVNCTDQPQEPAPGQLRYGAHHGYCALTILRQDEAPIFSFVEYRMSVPLRWVVSRR